MLKNTQEQIAEVVNVSEGLVNKILTNAKIGEIEETFTPLIAEKAKEKQGMRTDLLQNSVESYKPIDTQKELAATAGVSHDSIWKIEKIKNTHKTGLSEI